MPKTDEDLAALLGDPAVRALTPPARAAIDPAPTAPPLPSLESNLNEAPWQFPREEFLRRRPRPARGVTPPDVAYITSFVHPGRRAGTPGSVEIVPMAGPGMVGDIPGFKVAIARGADGQPIGALTLMPNERGQIDLVNVAVEPAHRRKGIATRLCQAARDAGYDVDSASGIEGLTDDGAAFTHARLVEQAIRAGKPVPPEVVAEFQHFKGKHPQAAPDAGPFDRLMGTDEGAFRPREFGRALQEDIPGLGDQPIAYGSPWWAKPGATVPPGARRRDIEAPPGP